MFSKAKVIKERNPGVSVRLGQTSAIPVGRERAGPRKTLRVFQTKHTP